MVSQKSSDKGRSYTELLRPNCIDAKWVSIGSSPRGLSVLKLDRPTLTWLSRSQLIPILSWHVL